MHRFLPLAGLAVLALACSDKKSSSTKPSMPPAAPVAEQRVPLVAQLIVLPAEVRVGTKPSTQPSRPATLRMTLVVTNTTADRIYRGEAPTAAVARFALTSDGTPIWSSSEFSAQVMTPVAIGPGQKVTYHEKVTVPDIRPYVGRQLEVRAEFAPAHLTATAVVPVR